MSNSLIESEVVIAKVLITERMSFTHAMQQIAANGKS